MREYDDDSNIQHYAPVLRRIIILVAVITAVPVMLWTITAFMHTYIAQPTISAPRPLAAATATAPAASPAADTAPANPPASSQPAQSVTDATATDDARGDRMRDSAANNAVPNVQVAALAPTPSAAAAAPPAPAAVTVQAAPAASAPSVFPDPPSVAPQQTTPVAPDSANDAAGDTLPLPDPITGPVPLPRHRPNVIALADTNIPLPRARPGDAPEPPSVTPDAPPSGYDPGIGH
jgi:hypothetical protein